MARHGLLVSFVFLGGCVGVTGEMPDGGARSVDAGSAVLDGGTGNADASIGHDASTPGDSGFGSDAGLPADAGHRADAGSPTDAGPPVDAGLPADAGNPVDSGSPADAGSPVDAGLHSDGGSPSGPDGGVDLCAGLVTGKALRPYSALAKPAKGQPVTDPDFGTTLVRITDVKADWNSDYAVPVYPTVPAWNIDESLLIVYVTNPTRGWALLNGKTYAFIKFLDIAPADVEQFDWDARDPDVLWYIDGRVLTRFHVSTGQAEPVHTFASAADWGADPMYSSWASDVFAVREPATNHMLSWRPDAGESTALSSSGDSPQACPSGTCLFWSSPSGGKVLNVATLATLRSMTLDPQEHGDLGLDSQGRDFFAAVSFDNVQGGGATLAVEWLISGTVKVIIGEANGDPYPPNGTLISAKALKRPSWVAVATTGDTAHTPTYLDQEILLANVETGQVCRAAHHRSRGGNGPVGYWAQPNVVLSPSGTRIVFPSDWGTDTVDTYVLELPTYR